MRQNIIASVDFLLYSSIFMAICAVVLCMETSWLLSIPLHQPGFYLFVGCSTLLQYNLHYYIKTKHPSTDRRTTWSVKHKKVHINLIILSTFGILAGLFTFTLNHFIIAGILGLLTLLYSFPLLPFGSRKRLKDFGLIKILLLTLTWTIITVWLPLAELGWDNDSWLLFIRRFLFMAALCLAFDIKDKYTDLESNIHTIPNRIGTQRSYQLIYCLLLLFVGFSIYYQQQESNLYQFNAMLLSAFATFLVIEHSKMLLTEKNRAVSVNSPQLHYLFLGGIDGMMFLQAALVFIGKGF